MRRNFYIMVHSWVSFLTQQLRCQWSPSSQTKADVGCSSYQENAELQLNREPHSGKPCFSTLVTVQPSLQRGYTGSTRCTETWISSLSRVAKCAVLFCWTRCQTTVNMNIRLLLPPYPHTSRSPAHSYLKIMLPAALWPQAFKEQNKRLGHVKRGQWAESKSTWPDVCFQAHDSAVGPIFTIVPRLFLHSF